MSDEQTAIPIRKTKGSIEAIVRAAYRKHGRGTTIKMAVNMALEEDPEGNGNGSRNRHGDLADDVEESREV